MDIPVLIEPVAGNGFRASGYESLGLSAEGATPEEAVRKLQELLQQRLNSGARLTSLKVTPGDNVWQEFAGMFKDDAYFDEVLKIMAEERDQLEDDPNYL